MRRESHVRRLPSIDALAFGVGVVALAGTYIYPRLEVAFALAVFLPSVLRELVWGMVAAMVQAVAVVGVSGMALVRGRD